jgi:hypothetical protein
MSKAFSLSATTPMKAPAPSPRGGLSVPLTGPTRQGARRTVGGRARPDAYASAHSPPSLEHRIPTWWPQRRTTESPCQPAAGI